VPARRLLNLVRRALRDPDVTATIARIEKNLRASQRNERRLLRHALRTRETLDALLRAAFLDHGDIPYPHRLTLQRFGIHSQNAEDGIVLALVRAAGGTSCRFVEIGCGNNGGNSGMLARDLGWEGVMIDGSEDALIEARLRFNESRVRFVHAHVSAENVNELVSSGGDDAEVDFLSIDIDGNDIWVWEALTASDPRIVAVEFNAFWGVQRSVAVPYDPAWRYPPGSDYFGASLAAFASIAGRKGYRLVAVEPRGANAFFLRDDVAPEIPRVEPADAYYPLLPSAALYEELGPQRARTLIGREQELLRRVRDEGLPLIDVD
jgi:hypothetical protein